MAEDEVVPLPERPDADEQAVEGPPAVVLWFPLREEPEGEPPESDGGTPPRLAI
jgi:hypothetical protein